MCPIIFPHCIRLSRMQHMTHFGLHEETESPSRLPRRRCVDVSPTRYIKTLALTCASYYLKNQVKYVQKKPIVAVIFKVIISSNALYGDY